MNDQYKKLSSYYDAFVQKNRDYKAIARSLVDIIGNSKTLLEIGIGTGLIAEQLMQIDPSYRITGIDNSDSLLALAKEKVGGSVDLHYQSISKLNLDKTFDVAYSRGGAWTFAHDSKEPLLVSHILDFEEIRQSFHCVANHLKPGGLLAISFTNAYGDTVIELDDGIVHKRIAKTEKVDDAFHAVFTYIFCREDMVLAQQDLRLRLLDWQQVKSLLMEAGFAEISSDQNEFCVYVKQGT
ncbi:MAG: class I SAM-dependent methyltransferase [Cyanobacteria bacterium J06592_8]